MPDGKDYILNTYNALKQKVQGFDRTPEEYRKLVLSDKNYRENVYNALQNKVEGFNRTREEFDSLIVSLPKPTAETKQPTFKQEGIPSFREFAEKNKMPTREQVVSDISTIVPSIGFKAEEKKQVEDYQKKALDNAITKNLTSKGIKFKVGDVNWKSEESKIRKQVEAGNLAFTYSNTGSPTIKRSLNPVESLIKGIELSAKDEQESVDFGMLVKNDDYNGMIEYADRLKTEDTDGVSRSPLSQATEVVGGLLLPATRFAVVQTATAGAGAIPSAIMASASMAPMSGLQGAKNNVLRLYNETISELEKSGVEITKDVKLREMKKASDQYRSGFISGIAGNVPLFPIASNVASNTLKGAMGMFVKGAVFDVATQVPIAAATSVAQDISAKQSGYSISAEKMFNNAWDYSTNAAKSIVALNIVTNAPMFPKYLVSAGKEFVRSMPKEDVANVTKAMEQAQVLPEGSSEKVMSDLDKYEQARSKVPDSIPEEDMPSFAGLMEKKLNLEQQKKNVDPSFHAKIDEQISAIDTRIKQMQESTSVMKDEVDDLTGETGKEIDEQIVEPAIKFELPKTKSSTYDTPVLKSAASNFDVLYMPKILYELAYENDVANQSRTGGPQTLDTIIKRGGYTIEEFNKLLPNWKELAAAEGTIPIRGGIEREVISDAEFNAFVDRGVVPKDRIESIADKISKNQKLSEREVAVYSAKGPEIETVVREISVTKPQEPEQTTTLTGVKYSDIVIGDKYLEDIISENNLNDSEKRTVRDIFSRYIKYFSFDKEGRTAFLQKFINPEDIQDVSDILVGVKASQESDFIRHNESNYRNVIGEINYIVNNPSEFSKNVVKTVSEIKQKLDNPESSFNRLYAVDIMKELGVKEAEPSRVPAEEKAYSVKYLERLDEKQLLKQIDKMDEPMDARGLAMKALVYGRRKVSQESFGDEVAKGRERLANPFVDKGGKGKGVSIERMAEDIWFDLPEELQAQMEPQDIRNELLDIIGTYTSTKKLAEDYVKRYTTEDMEAQMIEDDYVELGDRGVMKKSEWERWANEELTAEQVGLANEKVIDDLITKYEQEPTAKGEGIAPRKEGEAPKGVDLVNAEESARKNATPEELGGYEKFIADEQARPDFDAEYTANRTVGESKQEYLLRKYCK